MLYDKFELDTVDNPNANIPNVHFFGVPFTFSATDGNTERMRSIGYRCSRAELLDAFSQIPDRDPAKPFGNLEIFRAITLKTPDDSGHVTRILAPKAAGSSDWGTTNAEQFENASLFTHYWDTYINEHCWRPNREFSFYSKNFSDKVVYYGRVSPDGTRLFLYVDAQRRIPYQLPMLPRPSAPLGQPNYSPDGGEPRLFHNTDSNSGAIEWGFLLRGNAGSESGDDAYWNSDPVAMAIAMSICRGVMHRDDGCISWTASANYYRGRGDGKQSPSRPIYWYAKLLHDFAIDGQAYAFSYDDAYGSDPSI